MVKSVVAPFIVTEVLDHCLHYIGSRDTDEPATDQLHELEVAERLSDSLIIVKIRLLAKLGTPTYYVVVGNGSRNAETDLRRALRELPEECVLALLKVQEALPVSRKRSQTREKSRWKR